LAGSFNKSFCNFDKLLILIVYPKAETFHMTPVASWSVAAPLAKRLLVNLPAAIIGELPWFRRILVFTYIIRKRALQSEAQISPGYPIFPNNAMP
jgi:hypothetical protein